MTASTRRLRHHLGYLFLRSLLGLSPLSGLESWRAAGRALGRLAWSVVPSERARVAAHLALAFPDLDETARQRLARDCSRHLGELLGEVVWLWRATPEAILARTRFTGLEALVPEGARGSGRILVTAHCGNWEWMNLALQAAGAGMTVAAKAVFDPRLDQLTRRLRGRFDGETVLRGRQAGHRLSRALARGRVIGLLIDQDIDAPGCFVPFFGRPAWTPTGAAVLALRSRAPVVTGFAARMDSGDMHLVFDGASSPAAEASPPTAETLTARLTARIEAQIRSVPEQWVWMHRRWRRRPGDDDIVRLPDGRGVAPTALSGPLQS